MGKFIDLTGRRFGRLVVAGYAGKRRWDCRCDCGSPLNTLGDSLRTGRTTSCGCVWRERMKEVHSVHGKGRHSSYFVWKGMRARCSNKKHPDYVNYGGRGIRVCERWQEFEAFYQDFGRHRPSLRHTIDRYPDNDGDYKPGNVRWATAKEQGSNTRRVHHLTHDGRTMPAKAWAKEWGIPVETMCYWVRKNGPEEAIRKALKRVRTQGE